MLRVFISYATASERARAYIEELKPRVDALGALDWFRDVDSIRAGDPWRREIDAALHDCQAAVALLDEQALGRPWVQKEVTLFWHRKLFEAGFVFVPVRFVPPERFERDPFWRAVGIDGAQMLDGGDPASLDAIGARLQAADAGRRSPVERLVEDFTRALGARPPGRVQDALAEIDGRRATQADAPARLARGLLTADGGGFARAIRELLQEDLEVAQKLLPAYPFTWVEGDLAVRGLPTPARTRGEHAFLPCAAVVLRSPTFPALDARVVPWSWLVRGLCRPRPSTPRTLEGGGGGAREDVLDEVETLLRDELGPGDQDRRISRGWEEGDWFVVALPQPRVDLDLVRALVARFPSILFVLLVPFGVAIPDDPLIVAPRASREDDGGEEQARERDQDALDTWQRLCRSLGDGRTPYNPWNNR